MWTLATLPPVFPARPIPSSAYLVITEDEAHVVVVYETNDLKEAMALKEGSDSGMNGYTSVTIAALLR